MTTAKNVRCNPLGEVTVGEQPNVNVVDLQRGPAQGSMLRNDIVRLRQNQHAPARIERARRRRRTSATRSGSASFPLPRRRSNVAPPLSRAACT